MATNSDPPRALVTGASGYIASHVVKQLLARGDTRVRGTVRDLNNEKKVTPLREMMPDARYPLELVEADLLNAESWKEAVKDCTYVYHIASPIPVEVPRDESVLVRPAVDGTVNVLSACAEAGSVKRVVLTSSLGAVSVGMYGETGKEYTEDDWSPEELCPPYEKSKLLAERAAWEFVEKLDEERKFELATMLPGTAIGPFANLSADPISVQTVDAILGNKMPALIHLYLNLVDVRDVASAHIVAMEKPEAAGKRFIATCKGMWMKELSEIIAKEFQPQGYKLPSGWYIPKPGLWLAKFFNPTLARVYPALGKHFTYRTDRMRDLLGISTRDINETIIDTCYDLIEQGFVPKTSGYRGRLVDAVVAEPRKETRQQEKEEEGKRPEEDNQVESEKEEEEEGEQNKEGKQERLGDEKQAEEDSNLETGAGKNTTTLYPTTDSSEVEQKTEQST